MLSSLGLFPHKVCAQRTRSSKSGGGGQIPNGCGALGGGCSRMDHCSRKRNGGGGQQQSPPPPLQAQAYPSQMKLSLWDPHVHISWLAGSVPSTLYMGFNLPTSGPASHRLRTLEETATGCGKRGGPGGRWIQVAGWVWRARWSRGQFPVTQRPSGSNQRPSEPPHPTPTKTDSPMGTTHWGSVRPVCLPLRPCQPASPKPPAPPPASVQR